MPAALAPALLRDGFEDGWPSTTPVGMFLERIRVGDTAATAALVSGLTPTTVEQWAVRGAGELARAGTVARVRRSLRPYAAFAHELARAEATNESTLTAVIMDAALADERDAWRAASWLLDHHARATPTTLEVDDLDDDAADLSSPVQYSADDD
jgi:DNA-binding transcriptional regulator YdaS (Cro superfamily)